MGNNLPKSIRSQEDAEAMLNRPFFWNTAEWIAQWGDVNHSDDWQSMPSEGKQDFMARSREKGHADDYYRALYTANTFDDNGYPLWEDLAESQRSAIREKNNEYAREMQEFGRSLAGGNTE